MGDSLYVPFEEIRENEAVVVMWYLGQVCGCVCVCVCVCETKCKCKCVRVCVCVCVCVGVGVWVWVCGLVCRWVGVWVCGSVRFELMCGNFDSYLSRC